MKDIVTQNNLIAIIDGEPMTTSLALAEGTGNEHRAVIQLIRKYADDLQQFGTLAFEMRKSAGRPTEVANLNEPQSTLLMTYMKNTEIVRTLDKTPLAEYTTSTYKPMAAIRSRKLSGFFMPKISFMAVEESRISNTLPQSIGCKLSPPPSLFGGINLKTNGGHHA